MGGRVVSEPWKELESDLDFAAFLATLTPEQAKADLTATFSEPERKQAEFLAARSRIAHQHRNVEAVSTAVLMARLMAAR
jgi:hypothetical protein